MAENLGESPDRQAVEMLVKEHEGFVRGLAVRLSPDPAEADDIAQEAFMVALRKLGSVDATRDLRPWLAAIVRNLSRKAWEAAIRANKLKRDRLSEYLEELTEEPSELYEPEAKRALRTCLDKLPERSRLLLNLRYNLGHRSETIAGQTAATADAVRMALVRIRQQLRMCMAKTLGEARA